MKYFNKPLINHAFCIIIRFVFRKTSKKVNSRKIQRMYSYPFLEFSKIVAADVRSLLPASINQVGYKSVVGAHFDLKKFQIR